MDAQAIDIGEPGLAQPQTFAVRWRWSVVLFIALLAAAAIDTAILANEVRAQAIQSFTALPSCHGCTPAYTEYPGFLLVAAFAYGLAAVAAIPAILVIGLLGRRVRLQPSAITATALLAGLLVASVAARLVNWSLSAFGSSEAGVSLASVVIVPTIEETTKALAILTVGIAMAWRLGIRAGIVLGAAAGLLMTIFEIGLYVQLNVAGHTNTAYGTVIAIRLGLFGLGVHVVATAVAGAGIGAWLAQDPPRRWRVPAACLVAAIAIHGLWNLVGSAVMTRILLTLYPNPDLGMPGAFPLSVLFVASSLTQAVILGLPIAALVVAWRRDATRATPATPSSSSPALEVSQP